MNLFAYGTLMWPEIMSDVIGRKIEGCPARLSGARRLRVKDQVYPSLVPSEGSEVDGIIYFDLTESEIVALDRFEGDEYVRRPAEVLCGERTEQAEVYFASAVGLQLMGQVDWAPDYLPPPLLQQFRESYKGWHG